MILLISPKQVYATKRFIAEAQKLKVALKVLDAKDLARRNFKINISKYHTLFVRQAWPYEKQVIALAKRFHRAGKKVVDAVIAHGELGKGKWADYQKLQKAGLPIPSTCLNNGRGLNKYEFPFILKWIYGFKAKNVFLIKNWEQFKKPLPVHPKKEWMIQEFIPADYEYKVITVGSISLPVILRFEINKKIYRPDFKKIKVIHASGEPYIVKLAEKASKILKRELAKVDILESNGKFYILEVNRWPGLKSFEQLTKYNVAREFVEYLQN